MSLGDTLLEIWFYKVLPVVWVGALIFYLCGKFGWFSTNYKGGDNEKSSTE